MSTRNHEHLRELMKKYRDLVISYDDSLQSGNCIEGTREFARRYYPDRSLETGTITVEELSTYLDTDSWGQNVRRAIVYKLRQLRLTDMEADEDAF